MWQSVVMLHILLFPMLCMWIPVNSLTFKPESPTQTYELFMETVLSVCIIQIQVPERMCSDTLVWWQPVQSGRSFLWLALSPFINSLWLPLSCAQITFDHYISLPKFYSSTTSVHVMCTCQTICLPPFPLNRDFLTPAACAPFCYLPDVCMDAAGLALNQPGDLAISLGTSDTVSFLTPELEAFSITCLFKYHIYRFGSAKPCHIIAHSWSKHRYLV